MSDLNKLEEKHWAVKVERSAWGQGVISTELVATGLNFFDAKVEMHRAETKLMEEGWCKGAWTLKHPEKQEVIMVTIKWNGTGQN